MKRDYLHVIQSMCLLAGVVQVVMNEGVMEEIKRDTCVCKMNGDIFTTYWDYSLPIF